MLKRIRFFLILLSILILLAVPVIAQQSNYVTLPLTGAILDTENKLEIFDYEINMGGLGYQVIDNGTVFFESPDPADAIQHALDNGATVFMTSGVYHKVSNGVVYVHDNNVLVGAGESTVLDSIQINVAAHSCTLRNFTVTGSPTGGVAWQNSAIFIYGDASDVYVEDIKAFDLSSLVHGAFYIYVEDQIISNVTFKGCKAIDCGSHGFLNLGNGDSTSIIRTLNYIDCEAINCGKTKRYNDWVAGYVFNEMLTIEDVLIEGCYAEGNWESGFHFEVNYPKTNVVLRNCESVENGVKPNCSYGAGFLISSGCSIEYCKSSNNYKGIMLVNSLPSPAFINHCEDRGSYRNLHISGTAGQVEVANWKGYNSVESSIRINSAANIRFREEVYAINPGVNPLDFGASTNCSGNLIIEDATGTYTISLPP